MIAEPAVGGAARRPWAILGEVPGPHKPNLPDGERPRTPHDATRVAMRVSEATGDGNEPGAAHSDRARCEHPPMPDRLQR
jgi:hypothetical protein